MFRKKKTQSEEEISYKERVEYFWQWFSENSDHMLDAIDAGESRELLDDVISAMEGIGDFGWTFGPPAEGKEGHSFTITPGGDGYKQHLIEYCFKFAPALDRWTFYSSRQPSESVEGFKMKIKGEDFTALEFWVVAETDDDRERIDIRLWHPLFEELEEDDRYEITFLWLDECLGEFLVENQIGAIDIENRKMETAFPITELRDIVESEWQKQGWDIPNPNHTYYSLSIDEQHLDLSRLRGDVCAATTCHKPLISDFINSKGQLEHPTPNLGVDYLFVRIPIEQFDRSQLIDQRCEIEDHLNSLLEGAHIGRTLGGASGVEYAYIDILSFSTKDVIPYIKQTIESFPRAKGAEIYYFDKERISQCL